MAKIKASSLVESIIAMVIISIVMGYAMMIWLQVSKPEVSSEVLLLAQARCDIIFEKYVDMHYGENMAAMEMEFNQLHYVISESRMENDLIAVNISVSANENRIFYERQRLFYVK